jgi:maltose alpha-D-glucosyltransferase/alpha-amylase
VRTPMQWDGGVNAGFSTAAADRLYAPVISGAAYSPQQVNIASQQADPASLLNLVRGLIAVRKQHPAFSGDGFAWADVVDNPAIAAFYRSGAGETALAVHNLSAVPQPVRIAHPSGKAFTDLFTGQVTQTDADGSLRLNLPAHGFLWLSADV